MILEHKELKYKGKVVFEKLAISTFDRIPKLYKENEACFIFVNQGEFSVRTSNKMLSFKKDNGLLSKCFDYFFETSKIQRAVNQKIELIGVLIHPSIVEELFEFDLNIPANGFDYDIKRIEIDSLLSGFKDSIHTLLDHPGLADELLIKTKLKEFVLLICKALNVSSQLDFLASMFKNNESELRETISHNLYSNLSLEEFAHLCSMSLSSFKRKFNEIYEMSPRKYFIKMKLKKATELLKNKELRISDVAYDCGFDTISTFNRSFKTAYGKSPSEFRLD
ncbi:MAG: helix-turn-helix domain-containing protein [Crocinitomicaceae bacterium]